jgi:hypothetical protein
VPAGARGRGSYTAIYSARVRVTVHTDGRVVVRDGHGTGEAYGSSVGEVHDRALKAAETDATKRALATFGKAFGLALHNGNGKSTRPQASGHDLATSARNGSSPGPSAEGSADTLPGAYTQSTPARINGTAHIDKSGLSLSEPHRVRDKEHLPYVASQPCLICSASPADAHHLRFAQPRAIGRKVGDQFAVPLSADPIMTNCTGQAMRPPSGTRWGSTPSRPQPISGQRARRRIGPSQKLRSRIPTPELERFQFAP